MNLNAEETSKPQNLDGNDTPTIVELDIGIIGGGIAGLWLANRLNALGYRTALFEKKALGSDQTVASQGMIHGGIKYTLSGSLTGASESISDMPDYWKRCLAGNGEVDLTSAKILSDHFYFWASNSATSKMSTFFASKAVHGRVDKVSPQNFPSVFQSDKFSGQIYRLQDIVLDVPSVLNALAKPIEQQLFLLPSNTDDKNIESVRWQRNPTSQKNSKAEKSDEAELHILIDGKNVIVRAKRFIFCAGKGNNDLLEQLSIKKPEMQTRPLHQVWVKHHHQHAFYGHCLGADSTPRLSISTHPAADGSTVWSLGGSIAENGVKQSSEELIASARRELSDLFSWLDFSDAEFITARIDRAEARQRNFLRPDKAFVKSANNIDNVLVTWPTKLTLAPNLTNEVVALLQKQNIKPKAENNLEEELKNLQALQRPAIATPPWD